MSIVERSPRLLNWVWPIAFLLVPAAGAGVTRNVPRVSSASGQAGFIRIDGAAQNDQAADTVAGAGDVNGDGRPDVILDADEAGNKGGAFQWGSAYVVFGGSSPANVDLSKLNALGFRIDGHAENKGSVDTFTVAGAGDINGDGRADVVVGEALAGHNGREASGSVYAIFGRASPTNVDLENLGDRGIRIDGAAANDLAGVVVAGGGDVNGDGHADLLVEATPCCFGEKPHAVYVIFGGASSGHVDLGALGARGFAIEAGPDAYLAGLAGAGDVNGDGRSDVLLGVQSGPSYVVFGKPDTGTVDLARLGDRGFVIDGEGGDSVAAAGDVNADGLQDVIVGAPYAANRGRNESGSAYVVFGRRAPTNVDLDNLGTRGFRIDGAAAGDHAATSVAAAGDVNGDGRRDLVVGAPQRDISGLGKAGSAYVLFGPFSGANVDLAALGDRGFRIDGAAVGDFTGDSVAGPGDVNGDGRSDVLVGAPAADSNGHVDSGSAYVVFGKASASTVVLRAGADKTGPKLVLTGTPPGAQPVLAQKAVLVLAACNEPCTLNASGAVVLAKGSTIPLMRARATLTAPGNTDIRLALSAKALKRVRHALGTGRHPVARIRVRAVDRSGNATRDDLTVGIRR